MPGSYLVSNNPLITQVHNFINTGTGKQTTGFVSFSPTYDAVPTNNYIIGAKSPVKIIPVALSMAHDADNAAASLATYKFEVRCRTTTGDDADITSSNTTLKGTFEISNLAKKESKYVTITNGGAIPKNTVWGLYLSERTIPGSSTNVNEFTIKVYFTQP